MYILKCGTTKGQSVVSVFIDGFGKRSRWTVKGYSSSKDELNTFSVLNVP